jgi:hypothetical protein
LRSLNAPGFANNASKNFADGAFIERAAVDLLQTLKDRAFAVRIAEWELCGLFECPDFQCEARPDVQQAKQFSIDFIDFFAPILYVHDSAPGVKKNQPRLSGSRLAR